VVLFSPSFGIFTTVTLVSLSFLCHFNVLSVREELGRPTREKIMLIVKYTTIVPILLYLAVGFFGYLHFRQLTNQDILKNYPASDTLLFVGHVGLVITILLSIPLLAHPARHALLVPLRNPPADTHPLRVVTSTVILGGTWGVSTQIKNVVTVWNFAGSTVGLLVMYVLPPVCFLRLRSLRHHWVGPSWWFVDWKAKLAVSLAVCGVCLIGLSTYEAVKSVV